MITYADVLNFYAARGEYVLAFEQNADATVVTFRARDGRTRDLIVTNEDARAQYREAFLKRRDTE